MSVKGEDILDLTLPTVDHLRISISIDMTSMIQLHPIILGNVQENETKSEKMLISCYIARERPLMSPLRYCGVCGDFISEPLDLELPKH